MRFTEKIKRGGKTAWAFRPPKDVQQTGVVQYTVFKDKAEAKRKAPLLAEKVDQYRRGELYVDGLDDHSRLVHLVNVWINSEDFKVKTDKTKERHKTHLKYIAQTEVRGRPFGNFKLTELSDTLCSEFHDKLYQERGAGVANSALVTLSILLTFGISFGLVLKNYTKGISKKEEVHKGSLYWTQDQVETLLSLAYSDFKYRNLGVITQLCYEWGHHISDLVELTWSCVDFERQLATITQKSSGSVCRIPIEGSVLDLLKDQHNVWSFQEYVAPQVRPVASTYEPYAETQYVARLRELKKEAGLPPELTSDSLRLTAIKDMVDGGMLLLDVMQITGMKTLKGLKPFVKDGLELSLRYLIEERERMKLRGETK